MKVIIHAIIELRRFRTNAVLTWVLLCMPIAGFAAEFTIPHGLHADIGDANPGDGIAETIDGITTLRAAVEESNALAGPDTVYLTDESPTQGVDAPLTVTDDLEIRAPDQLCDLGGYQCGNIIGINENLFTVSQGKTLTLFMLYVDGCRNAAGDCSTVIVEPGARLVLVGSVIYGAGLRGGAVFNRGGEVYLSSAFFEEFLVDVSGKPIPAGREAGSRKIPPTLPPVAEVGSAISGWAEEDGGGIYNEGGLVVATGKCSLSGHAGGRGGGIYNDGGIIRISALGAGPHYSNFDRGQLGGSASSGGFLYNAGGTAELEEFLATGDRSTRETICVADGAVTVRNAHFWWMKVSGAVHVTGGTFRAENTLFSECEATGDGGALHASGGTAELLNCTFGGNQAAGRGGAIYAGPAAALTMLNCTLAGNTAAEGGGLYSETPADSPTIRLGNTVVAQNTAALAPDASGMILSLGHNLIGKADGAAGFTAAGDLTGTVASPLDARLSFPLVFHDDLAMYTAAAVTPIYAILEDSPARDAGSTALLLDTALLPEPPAYDQRGVGYARYQGTEVDIGAYEYPVPRIVPEHHHADQDADGRIDLSEALRIVQFYNSSGFHCDPLGEDGFAPGPGDQTCIPHNADYAPQDWRIGLSELLRLVQLYNSPAYHPCPEGEDGYCPGV